MRLTDFLNEKEIFKSAKFTPEEIIKRLSDGKWKKGDILIIRTITNDDYTEEKIIDGGIDEWGDAFIKTKVIKDTSNLNLGAGWFYTKRLHINFTTYNTRFSSITLNTIFRFIKFLGFYKGDCDDYS